MVFWVVHCLCYTFARLPSPVYRCLVVVKHLFIGRLMMWCIALKGQCLLWRNKQFWCVVAKALHNSYLIAGQVTDWSTSEKNNNHIIRLTRNGMQSNAMQFSSLQQITNKSIRWPLHSLCLFCAYLCPNRCLTHSSLVLSQQILIFYMISVLLIGHIQTHSSKEMRFSSS